MTLELHRKNIVTEITQGRLRWLDYVIQMEEDSIQKAGDGLLKAEEKQRQPSTGL